MSWWLVGSGTDLNVSLSHTGIWSLNGRPSPKESLHDIVHDPASGVDVSRIRGARASWHLSSSLAAMTSDARYEEMVRRRHASSMQVTLGVAVFWPHEHGDDTIEFHLIPPPSALEVLRPMFNRIIGRADVSYRIASAQIRDREVLPGDWPTAEQILEGRPHLTAGVEFSIFATAAPKHVRQTPPEAVEHAAHGAGSPRWLT